VDDALAAAIERAVAALEHGGVVVYPTETLYGLGVDAASAPALDRLGVLKGRDRDKPVSVLVASRRMLEVVVISISPVAERLIEAFWPGPLTLAFAARSEVAAQLTAGSGTIAARISSDPVAQALVERFGRPITSTSANPGGSRAPTEVSAARRYFGAEVDVYVDSGTTHGGHPSTVLDCSRAVPRLVREGAIALDRIEAVAGVRVLRE
jgi:L-threonylcarbamoyladenylate synthase